MQGYAIGYENFIKWKNAIQYEFTYIKWNTYLYIANKFFTAYA